MSLSRHLKTTKTVVKEINVINHKEVNYKNKKYIVGYIPFKDDDKLFIIDESKKTDIIEKIWSFKKESGYIAKSNTNGGERSELYLHNFLMNKLDNNDQTSFIDHINDHGCDNRLENLRILCPNCHAQTNTYRGKNKGNV